MVGLSDYLESGVINFLFRGNTNSFISPGNLSIALCSGVPQDHQTGSTIPEIASGVAGVSNGYKRYNLGSPSDSTWRQVSSSGFINNLSKLSFPECANTNWGLMSGVAICDKSGIGTGQVLMHGKLSRPTTITTGETFAFNIGDLEIDLF
tara:strand:- start:140 stop:589 length:450 start_codon:yes stop_codon:yes gene_type:complete